MRRHCEISSLSITQAGPKTHLDGAIVFSGGGIGFLIRDVSMYGVWRGISCSASSYVWRVKIRSPATIARPTPTSSSSVTSTRAGVPASG